MNSEYENIMEYEDILMGNGAQYKSSFSKSNNLRSNRIEFGNIWRYAITHLLHWTPQKARMYLNEDIVHNLKLDMTYDKIGIKPKKDLTDYRIVLQYAFPDVFHFSMKEQVIQDYQRATLTGDFINDDSGYRIPKKFFTDSEGTERSHILMNYVISQYMSDMSIPELYEFFSNTQKANSWLSGKKLGTPMRIIYGNALDYFHHSLPYDKKDYLLYYTYKINDTCKEYKKAHRNDDKE